MSCDCNSQYVNNGYNNACSCEVPYPQVSHESVPSLIDNLVTALYGAFYNPQTQTGYITKSVVNGRIVWNIPCDPVTSPAEISWLPRHNGEGLLCYLIRTFNATFPVFVTLDGVQTLTNKTLTAPVINNPTGILATDIGAGALGDQITIDGTQITGTIPNNVTTATSGATADAIVTRDASGNFSANNVYANLVGSATNIASGNVGSIPYQSGSGATTFLAAGTIGKILVQNSGSPAWGTDHLGTTTNDNASTGYVGEYVSSSLSSVSAITLSTSTAANVTSISLTAGDWDVYGVVDFSLTGTTSAFGTNGYIGGVNSSSATIGATDTYFNFAVDLTTKTGAFAFNVPTQRISVSTTTTIYLIAQATFSAGTTKAYGTIRARRMR
jgi:hypothetical protein